MALYLFLISFHSFVPQVSVDLDDVVRRALSQDGRGLTLRILNVLLHKCDAQYFHLLRPFTARLTALRSRGHVK